MKQIFAILFVIFVFSAVFPAQTARKTVTNANLEKFKRERVKADPDDERERERLGLPSREQQERERQERFQALSELGAKIRQQESQTENFWKNQAFEVRTEIAAVDGEINYVTARINELPRPQTYYAVGYNPYYSNCCYGGYGASGLPYGTSKTIIGGAHIGGKVVIGRGKTRGVIGANIGKTVIRHNNLIGVPLNTIQAPRTNLTFGGIPYQPGILTVPFTLPTAQNLTREELLSRLRLLEQTRAGLLARWNILEEEARRAGVKID